MDEGGIADPGTVPKPQTEIYFFHIPKTAGTSLTKMIRCAYEAEEAIPAWEWPELKRLTSAQINSYRCYSGHFGTALYSVFDRKIPTVTLLRDPYDRTISSIRYTQKFTEDPILKNLSPFRYLVKMQGINPNGSIDTYPNVVLRDIQTRYLGIDLTMDMFPDHCNDVPDEEKVYLDKILFNAMWKGIDRRGQPDGKLQEKMHKYFSFLAEKKQMDMVYEKAKRRLDSMAVVGTVERFTETTELIFDLLGVPMPETLAVDNVTTGHVVGLTYRETHSRPWLDCLIDAYTRYDRKLYRYANELLDHQLDDYRRRKAKR